MSDITFTLPDDVISSFKNIAFTYNKSCDEVMTDLLQTFIDSYRSMHQEV